MNDGSSDLGFECPEGIEKLVASFRCQIEVCGPVTKLWWLGNQSVVVWEDHPPRMEGGGAIRKFTNMLIMLISAR